MAFSPGLGGKTLTTGFDGKAREVTVSKPLLVTIGENFRAIIMTVKSGG